MVINKCKICPDDNHIGENKDILKSLNLKSTKKRLLLMNCFRHSDSPLSAEDVYHILNKEIDINMSTVYRILNYLTDYKFLMKQTLSDGNSVFQLNDYTHQHLLTCKICGEMSYIDSCPIDLHLDDISEKTGYEITSHNLEFIGICSKCKDKK
ncbi:Fur family transcriptional regulator [Peptostreptococcus faecalis]|uniref:Fur family transcriptional regulator n=1 Tax=Peptostreptococcus faecalis TaxID=2045015 RepID=UPI001FA8E137|nr:Fur family transcriptional regulator [Peptostreptococcus faecalis]